MFLSVEIIYLSGENFELKNCIITYLKNFIWKCDWIRKIVKEQDIIIELLCINNRNLISNFLKKILPKVVNLKLPTLIKVQPRKLDLRQKIDNFAFKNSNIIIEGLIWKRKESFFQEKKSS